MKRSHLCLPVAGNNVAGKRGTRQGLRRVLAAGVSLMAALTISQTALAGTPAADANVKLVQTFLADVRVATFQHHDPKEIRSVSERYISGDYVQHSAGMEPGRDGYIDSMVKLAKGPEAGGPPMPPIEDLYWIADGDKVVWVSRIQLPGQDKPEFMFNMMRIQNGKIVEHWGK
ncbi:hypothetical protein WSK_2871 [Novosphingobium sp. Rr 2-17]|uniref:nuclear transport factor 2 family protein n=1 Tax=Novosphingobium sp. Rr 2-17 TaxID=555793 RepID=UPI0002699BE0|nr:hypothetical protein [Novosphingobium sp. Rr 2-17]EIZ78823.1 hypothetical protein WSK_2871 [Novosphingobium sp. Rr 2-17]